MLAAYITRVYSPSKTKFNTENMQRLEAINVSGIMYELDNDKVNIFLLFSQFLMQDMYFKTQNLVSERFSNLISDF